MNMVLEALVHNTNNTSIVQSVHMPVSWPYLAQFWTIFHTDWLEKKRGKCTIHVRSSRGVEIVEGYSVDRWQS